MRTRLPDKRFSVNLPITWNTYGGREQKIIVTIGFDRDHRPLEVFCADFRSGSDNQAIIMDCCILLSRLLQHGDTPAELAASMCSPPSLIGTIAQAIMREVETDA